MESECAASPQEEASLTYDVARYFCDHADESDRWQSTLQVQETRCAELANECSAYQACKTAIMVPE